MRLITIKNHKIFHIINEISEALSLSNDPRQLTQTALDTVIEVLAVDCCWIQLGSTENQNLAMVGCRGFTPHMKNEIGLGSLEHDLVKQVAGLGQKIIIPDLSREKVYHLSAFREAGLSSLAAVPIQTYRIHGIMGIASKSKLRLDREFTELLVAVAGVVGMVLNKAILMQNGALVDKRVNSVYKARVESAAEESAAQKTVPQQALSTITAHRTNNTVYELTRFNSVALPQSSSEPAVLVKPTLESADVLAEFGRLWGNLPQKEEITIERIGREELQERNLDTIAQVNNLAPAAQRVSEEPPALPGASPLQSITRESRDSFTEHCRKVRSFRIRHASII